MKSSYDAVMLLSFGGPEKPADVMPFLRNVVRGRNVPDQRLQQVAEQYHACGGRSPLNDQNRTLRQALEDELRRRGWEVPVYWGNRNWNPYVTDVVREMADAGIKHALVLATSAYSSYSGCRQYWEDLWRARAEVGERAPRLDKIGAFCGDPRFAELWAERVREPLGRLPEAALVFTAHSLPLRMAEQCRYVEQLREVASRVAALLSVPTWDLVYQSRSGPPHERWLEPDLVDHLSVLRERGARSVVVAPIGFLSDHMEVIYDLDIRARAHAESLGMRLERASTIASQDGFIVMICDLIEKYLQGAELDVCQADCCHGASL